RLAGRSGTLGAKSNRGSARAIGEVNRVPQQDSSFFGLENVRLGSPWRGSHREQTPPVRDFAKLPECEEGDLNPHGCLAHYPLKLAGRLVPPSPRELGRLLSTDCPSAATHRPRCSTRRSTCYAF